MMEAVMVELTDACVAMKRMWRFHRWFATRHYKRLGLQLANAILIAKNMHDHYGLPEPSREILRKRLEHALTLLGTWK